MDRKHASPIGVALIATAVLAVGIGTAPGRVLEGKKVRVAEETARDNRADIYRRLRPRLADFYPDLLPLERDHPWSLPKRALGDDQVVTMKILVLRFSFQADDDPQTTGTGRMDTTRPIERMGEAAYLDSVGDFVDPPPHDSAYFHHHVVALHHYYKTVSDGHLEIDTTGDYVWPPGANATYDLLHPMSYYGACIDELDPEVALDSVVAGLERFFVDCINTADTTTFSGADAGKDIDFGQYQSIFLIHAGADAQNDILDNSCHDLFSGWIRYKQALPVNEGANWVRTALMLPETSSQDGRAVALNGLIAHEFCHRLGAVDLYNTRNFATVLGDFALMDHNGNGTGIDLSDYGFRNKIFNAIPVFPCAWTRAYLGFVEVEEVRRGADLRLLAAEVASTDHPKVIKVPISETEYYLLENRVTELDGLPGGPWFDSITYVIRGPGRELHTGQGRVIELTREYDALIPVPMGDGGVLIYRIDETVAAMNYTDTFRVNDTVYGDLLNNFYDNDLQWDPERKFITLIEGDGIINLQGTDNCRSGCGLPYFWWGWEGDMYRDDRTHAFTPFTNPATLDHAWAHTRIFIDDIHRYLPPGGKDPVDTLYELDVNISDTTLYLAGGYPVRVGSQPDDDLCEPRPPVVDDLDKDGTREIIVVADKYLSVFTTAGGNFLHESSGCSPCRQFYDTARLVFDPDSSFDHPTPISRIYELPLFAMTPTTITAGPVTGDFGVEQADKFVAIGQKGALGTGIVQAFQLSYDGIGGLAEEAWHTTVSGEPAAMSFGRVLYVLTRTGWLYRITGFAEPHTEFDLGTSANHGLCRMGTRAVVLAGDDDNSWLFWVCDDDDNDTGSYSLDGYFSYGPVAGDLNRDGLPEIAVLSRDGQLKVVTLDTTGFTAVVASEQQVAIGAPVTTDPVMGDVDRDGSPDIVFGGVNAVHAFGTRLLTISDFPRQVDDRYPNSVITAAPINADVTPGGFPEVVIPTSAGNVYAFGANRSPLYPLTGGGGVQGSPVVFPFDDEGRLGYVGTDGWFYLWRTGLDSGAVIWPMGGFDPAGSFALDDSVLPPPAPQAARLPEAEFYNYPNPVTEGLTKIRYVLGQPASRVSLTIYDLSGTEVHAIAGDPFEGPNEKEWDCGTVTPGVYRCVIEVDFVGGGSEHAFTDIAVIR